MLLCKYTQTFHNIYVKLVSKNVFNVCVIFMNLLNQILFTFSHVTHY